ncbi:DUF2190 family protein [Photobacterium leiognathi]|uniref:DUF2190 family protein n=1 Tax=Photobacterium leiognathi TaxID=553611 RepID=UPI00273A10E2|nr:capsid cement protein [Photobacterium leiognathi]
MATNFIQSGTTITITPLAAIKSGEPVAIGSIVVVALSDIAIGQQGEAKADGVWSLPKAAGAIEQGAVVYLADGEISTVDTGTYAGIAWQSAGAGDAHVNVKLGQAHAIVTAPAV